VFLPFVHHETEKVISHQLVEQAVIVAYDYYSYMVGTNK
jgi:hypothetical protein